MPDYKISTGLPGLPVTQDEKKFADLRPIYQALNTLAQVLSIADGRVDYSQIELAQRNQLSSVNTQNHKKLFAYAETDLDYGRIVNLYLSGGKICARYADCSDNTKPAQGIVNNSSGILTGEYGEVVLAEGFVQGISGTSVGTTYYLSTAGQVTNVLPTGTPKIVQAVGWGLGSTGFYMNISSLFIQL